MLFDIMTPLGFSVHCTEDYWDVIVSIKHPVMADRLEDVKRTVADPDHVCRSRKDENVLLFYRADERRCICAVARRQNGDGFLITTYPTDAIKAGERVWSR